MISPGGFVPPGLAWCGFIIRQEDPISRILSCAVIPLDAASPRTFISDLPGGFDNCSSRLGVPGRYAAWPDSWPTPPSLFGLAPCGVYPASDVTAGAVRSYRTFSPLPDWPSRRTPFGPACPCRSTSDRRFVFCGTCRPWALKPTSRTLSGTLPCGVRTFLPRTTGLRPSPAATARSSCQLLV